MFWLTTLVKSRHFSTHLPKRLSWWKYLLYPPHQKTKASPSPSHILFWRRTDQSRTPRTCRPRAASACNICLNTACNTGELSELSDIKYHGLTSLSDVPGSPGTVSVSAAPVARIYQTPFWDWWTSWCPACWDSESVSPHCQLSDC